MKWVALVVAILAAAVSPIGEAAGHEVRPGYLELRELHAGRFHMLWKVPALGALRLGITPQFPAFCHLDAAPTSMQAGDAFIESGRIRCERTLRGEPVAIRGLDATMTDVLVRVEALDGTVQNVLLSPASPSFVVTSVPDRLDVLATYLRLGIEHILTGPDHLLFVLCLLLLVPSLGKLLATVTAFTLAHSLTLGAATLGFIDVPAPPIEAMIALSIVFLAAELLRGDAGRSAITRSYPWLLAFSFGLLHGLGFAGALAEIGLPHGEIPAALFAFNIGVELGQLAFIGGVLAAIRIGRMLVTSTPVSFQHWAAYGIGSVASFWLLQRILAIL